jgi:hypothetical protein
MRRGLAYNIAVTFFFYYLLGYALNRLTGRTVVGMAPAVRDSARRAGFGRTVPGLTGAAAWLVLAALAGDLALHLADRL